ncbi:putative ribonuclease H-like domain-containing protein [Tanacetum coccineum]|uniref:Ribonuclease H-like domain-containing protein n=1 Tax=Tanacetum coccineum TaxID=301880 RepID=A0ABQ4WGA9_9ASTR
MVPRAVLMKSGLVSVNTARQVNVAHSKTTVNAARPKSHFSKTTHSIVKRPIHKKTTFKNNNFNQRVNTVKDKNVNAARPKAVVNAARPKAVVNAVKGNNVNAVKASACWGNPQVDLQDQGVIDSGCSRHMTGNMSYLTDYEEIDGGCVAFGGNPKGGKITRKGTQSNGFACKKASDNAGQARKETKPVKDYILLQLWTADPPFSQNPKSSDDDGFKPSSDVEKKVNEDPRKERECNDQEKEDNVNNTNNFNNISSTVNVVGTNEDNAELLIDLNMPALEGYNIFDLSSDDQEDGAEADMTIWIQQSKNKKDERGIVIRNIARLVAQRYTQEEGINYDEVLTPVARIEAIRLFLAYVSFKYFVVYQMDVKSAFLYGNIEEEVYVCQPPGFEDPDFPDKVYKVEKALFQRGKINKTLFIKRYKGDILLVQVYVDDIIFGSIKKELCIAFEKLMHDKFQMSSMGELTFFLGLQVKQKKDGIFISQDKYVGKILKKFGFIEVKTTSTPMETQKPLLKDEDGEDVDVHIYRSMIGSLMYLTSSRPDIMFAVCACARYQVNPKISHLHVVKRIFSYLKGQPKLGLWYLKDSPFDLVAYTDSDYAGVSLDRKSIIGGCHFLRCKLISWQCKKQTVVGNSITEAEYVAASSCYLLTKAFDVSRIQYLISSIGMLNPQILLVILNTAEFMLLVILNTARYNLILLVKVNAARHKLNTAVES